FSICTAPGPPLARVIAIARSSASLSIGWRSSSSSSSVSVDIIEALKRHFFVVAHGGRRLRLRHLQCSASRADMEPLGQHAKLTSGGVVDAEPGRWSALIRHHAVLLQLKGRLFAHHRQFSPPAKQLNVTAPELTGRATRDEADKGLPLEFPETGGRR